MSIFFNLQSTSATSVYAYNGGLLDYDGYIWSLAGGPGIGATTRIVRSSDYGVTWELVTDSSNIGVNGSSLYHASIVYEGYMWVIGGMWSGGTSNAYVRRTTNGISFTYLTYPDGGSPDYYSKAVCVHKGRLYMSGGTYYGTNNNAVLSTLNGISWTTHHNNGGVDLPLGLYNHVMYSFNDNLYIGATSGLYVSYDDGANWSTYSTGVAPFNGLGLAYGAVVAYGYVYVLRYDGLALYYSENGEDFYYENPTSGTTVANSGYALSYNYGRLMVVGGYTNGPTNSGRTYRSLTIPHYNSTISFTLNNIHSPSPAYIRLVDSSEIYDVSGTPVNDCTRIWSIVNNRTLEEILYSTSAAEFEIALNGIAGDTFNVSLSAVF